MKDTSKKSLPSLAMQEAMLHYKSGQFAVAEEMCRKILLDDQKNMESLQMLGAIAALSGRYEEAVDLFSQVIKLKKNNPRSFFDLGLALEKWGKLDEALLKYKKAVILKPDYIEAHFCIGNILKEQGRFDEAELKYKRVIALKPDYADAHNHLGIVLRHLGQLDAAIQSYRQALKIKPDHVDAYNNLGNVLQLLGRLDDAVASYRRALEINPAYAKAHNNLANALQDMGQLDAAVASYKRALEINPLYAEAYSNLGNVLKDLGQLDNSIASFRRALEIKPDDKEAQANLSSSLLISGMFSEGWQKYECRWEGLTPKVARPATRLPQWTGQHPNHGDRLLIFGEQGFGDKLQFSRYIPLAVARFPGGVSVVVDSSLHTLFRRSYPGVEFLDSVPTDQSAWQWQCPQLSLPLAFGTTLENIPGQKPYLVPDPIRIADWKSKIATLDLPAGTRKIGVVWRPGKGVIAKVKAVAFQQIIPLLEQSRGITWFSLQKEHDPDSAPWAASGKLIDWADEFKSFDDTAALMMNLDMIISVDTSVAHLAGGLGLPTWLFNRHSSDWRWMRGCDYSPWYPTTIRIFTQEVTGDWDGVVKRMVAALSEMNR